MGSGDRISDKEKTILWFQVSLYQILLADGNSPPRLSEVFAWIVVGAHYHNPQATDQKKIQFFFDPDCEMLFAPTNFPQKNCSCILKGCLNPWPLLYHLESNQN